MTSSLPRSFALRFRSIAKRHRLGGRSVALGLSMGAAVITTGCSDATAPVETGGIALEIAGLPSGVAGDIRLSQGTKTRTASASSTIEGLEVGAWVLSASSVTVEGVVYAPEPATLTVNVPARAIGTARVVWTPTTGALQLSILGLPADAVGDVLIAGPNVSRVVTVSSLVTGLPPAQYTVTPRDVRSTSGTLRGDVASQAVSIVASAIASSATVSYAFAPSAVDLSVTGLPNGTGSNITLTSPAGVATPVGGTTRVSPAAAGRWRYTASNVQANGFTYAPSPAARDTTVLAGDTLRFPVTYAVSTGALAVAVTGLPQGATGSVRVTGPQGFARDLTATTTLIDLTPGTYTVVADTVVRGGLAWRPASAQLQLAVGASLTAVPAIVNYSAVAGTLVVSLSGLPSGTSGSVRVTGPYGFDRTITSTTVFSATAAGQYIVNASSVLSGPLMYAVTPPSVTRTVEFAGRDSVDMRYVSQTGSLQLTVSGLPPGISSALTLVGAQTISIGGSTTLTDLPAGSYTLNAANVNAGGTNYAPTPATQNITIATGAMSTASVAYAAVLTSGSLRVTISGLPGGANAAVTLTGGPQPVSITGTTTIAAMAVGSYALTAANVSANGVAYAPVPASQSVTITNAVQTNASVSYAAVAASGSLQVTVTGLPNGTNAAITLAGPQSASITGTTLLNSLPLGNYTLTAANVTAGATTYTPAPTTRAVTISNGVQSSAAFVYTAMSSVIDLVLDQAYLTQATQNTAGTVAMVAGRDALLRVFAHADRANALTPTVRARVYDGASLLQTLTLTGPSSGVPMVLDEATLSSTWNVLIAGANIRTATRVLVDIDPANTVTEADEANNIWPRNGTPQNMTVNAVPAFTVRFVPVTVGTLTGNVTAGNMNSFLTTSRLMWPIFDVNADVRAPFTSSADTLVSNDANGKWLTVLSEMNTLRSVDGAPSTMHYYGVVKVGYNSGVAGYGYVPGRAAMGWDYLPSGDGVAAHEWGHNFNRPHAPCGGAAGPDPAYPYAGGDIGVVGWNSSTNALVATTRKDLMGYCSPTWISDYNWTKVLNYRLTSGFEMTAQSNNEGLLVWGRVVNGKVLLEPAFRVTAPRTAAVSSATHVVEALDADGNLLMELPISAERVDHVTDHDERQFSVILPWTTTLENALSRLRVRDVRTPLLAASRASVSAVAARLSRGTARTTRPALVMPDPESAVDAAPAGRMRVRWNAAQYPMAMVRDVTTGQVMGYVRRPGDAVVSGGRRLEVVYSDGVRSVVRPGR